MQRNSIRHRCPETGDLRANDIIVVDEQRRAASLGDQLLRRITADQQLPVVSRREMGRDRSDRFQIAPYELPYSAAIASYFCAARYFSASSAAMHPVPAAVTACR